MIWSRIAPSGGGSAAGAGAADEQGEDVASVPGCRGLARTQQAGAAQGDDLVEGGERVVGADVEGAVEGDRQRPGGGDQPSHRRQVNGPLRRQHPDDNARRSNRLAILDVFNHLVQIGFVIDKIFCGEA